MCNPQSQCSSQEPYLVFFLLLLVLLIYVKICALETNTRIAGSSCSSSGDTCTAETTVTKETTVTIVDCQRFALCSTKTTCRERIDVAWLPAYLFYINFTMCQYINVSVDLNSLLPSKESHSLKVNGAI